MSSITVFSMDSPLGTNRESVTELGSSVAVGMFPPSGGLIGGPQIYMSTPNSWNL